MIGIYKITSPTNKIYIGQTWNINRTKDMRYKNLNCKGQLKLYNSLVKYGWNNHIFETEHELNENISQQELDDFEIKYWQQYKDQGFEMLNIKEPGRGGKHSKETCEKISKARIGRKDTEETKLKRSISNKGQKRTEEQKQKMRGRIDSEDVRLKRANSLKGKIQSQETIQKRVNTIKEKGLYKIGKQLLQYDLNGNFVKEWNKMIEASKNLNIDSGSITNCCKNKQNKAGNFQWVYKTENYPLKIKSLK